MTAQRRERAGRAPTGSSPAGGAGGSVAAGARSTARLCREDGWGSNR